MKLLRIESALLAAVAAALNTGAHAVDLNPDGLGQVLIYPYYTVNKGNSTLLSVVNTTSHAKAVKVRFREGRNGRDTLEFNLYLSAFDVWSAALFARDETGPANLLTTDSSCTVPVIVGSPDLPVTSQGLSFVPFRNAAYAFIDDKGGAGLDRTREGYVELIEMGELSLGDRPTQLQEEVTHLASGLPKDCAKVTASWQLLGGGWAGDSRADIGLPSGGLRGTATIVDVGNGTLHAYAAEAIEGFYTNSADPGRLHTAPGSTKPDLGDADNGGGVATSYVHQADGTLVSSQWPTGSFDAVSALYLHDAISNEFYIDPSLGASSEWIVTFPTKNHYTDKDAPAIAPFTDVFPDDGQACELVGVSVYDRNEAILDDSIQFPEQPPHGFTPPPPGVSNYAPQLCFAAQVITFGQEADVTAGSSRIFGSRYAANASTYAGSAVGIATSGWVRLDMNDGDYEVPPGFFRNSLVAPDGTIYHGLPVTGFWAANYVNAQAQPGKLANYSGAYRHAGSRNIVAGAGAGQ